MSFKNRIADILVVAARNLAIEISPDARAYTFTISFREYVRKRISSTTSIL